MLAPDNDKHLDSALPHPTSTSMAVATTGTSCHAVKWHKSNTSTSLHRTNPTWPSDNNKASESYADNLEEEEEPSLHCEEGEANGGKYVDEEKVENARALRPSITLQFCHINLHLEAEGE